MYCPKCSQQQISDDVSFCSRCGFRLRIVSELLVTNGALTTSPRNEADLGLFKGKATLGAKIMFFGIALIPFSIVFSIALDSPGPFALPFLLFMIGITQWLYVKLFGTSARQMPPPQPAIWGGAPPYLNMPYQEKPPLAIEGTRRINTAEIRQPSSVTENTTKLLDNPE
jgi:hypothetical protein